MVIDLLFVEGEKKIFQIFRSTQFRLLLFWTVLGTILRLTQLTAKPPWTDEFATLVFSLGNDFKSVPLDQIISIETLLQPLQPNPSASVSDIISLVIHQDNHPPLYFVLTHLWLNLFPSGDPYISLWFSRLLPALFGIFTIPSVYVLTLRTFTSLEIANLTAMLMAFSPYAVFLSQEARQYSLAILLVTFSLGCLLTAIKQVDQKKTFSGWLVFFWIGVNSLGLLTHYFFSLTIAAQVLALLIFYLRRGLPVQAIKRFLVVFVAAATTGLIWLKFVLPKGYGQSMTSWIHQDNSNLLSLVNPVFQLLGAWLTMLCLLPVESPYLPIVLLSGLLMLFFFIWVIPGLYWGIKAGLKTYPFMVEMTLSFTLSAICLFFLLTYLVGIDITRGARYSFVYFPAVIILLGVALSCFSSVSKKKDLIIVSLVVFFSAITVVFNLGYQKYYRPDLLIPILESNSSPGVMRIIATPYKSLVQIGEMMGIAWVLHQDKTLPDTHFLLWNHLPISQTLAGVTSNFDLWLIDSSSTLPKLPNCQLRSQRLPFVNGYPFHRYQCHHSNVESKNN